jgi:DNA-binding MarR family transcriptional regulator
MRNADEGAARASVEFAASLLQLSNAVLHELGEVSRTYGLTQQQSQLMCALLDEPVGMTMLSRRLHLEKASVTGLVDRIERRGMVERLRDPADRRTCRVALTDQGRDICAAAVIDVAARLQVLVSGFSPRGRRNAEGAIEQMLVSLVATSE